jgi:hypothetical protein
MSSLPLSYETLLYSVNNYLIQIWRREYKTIPNMPEGQGSHKILNTVLRSHNFKS